MTSTDKTIPERLREEAPRVEQAGFELAPQIMSEAADRIDALEKVLAPFAGREEISEAETAIPNDSPVTIRCQLGDVRRARAALHPSDNDAQVAGPMK